MSTNKRSDDDQDKKTRRNGMETLRHSEMMAHLLDALEKKTDIGEYGRLTFVMVARHFLDEEEIVDLLVHQPGFDEEAAHALFAQVQSHDYNPPKRERILQWQSQQDFPICPRPDEPNACNVYKDFEFPQQIYDRIGEFWEEKSEETKQGGD